MENKQMVWPGPSAPAKTITRCLGPVYGVVQTLARRLLQACVRAILLGLYFGSMKDDYAFGLHIQWDKIHKEELQNFYCLPSNVRVIKWTTMRRMEYVTHTGDMRNAYKILIEKYSGSVTLVRSRTNFVIVNYFTYSGENLAKFS
jgi:hypothetical protein